MIDIKAIALILILAAAMLSGCLAPDDDMQPQPKDEAATRTNAIDDPASGNIYNNNISQVNTYHANAVQGNTTAYSLSSDDTAQGRAEGNSSPVASRIKAVATIGPLGEFVRAVGGNLVDVTIMIPPGAEPHTFEPSPSDIRKVTDADIYFKSGAGLEYWIDKIIAMNGNMTVVDTSEGISFISEDPASGQVDPHIWLSPKNAMIQVNNICNGFIKIDPANKERYISSRDAYQQDLMRMDSILNQSLSSGKRKIFVVHHPAWSYLASEYGLTQIPLMENEKEPGPRYLAWVIETARMNGVKTIFVEPQYNPKAAMVIAGEMNCTVETIDPLAENYLESLERSGRLIAESLG